MGINNIDRIILRVIFSKGFTREYIGPRPPRCRYYIVNNQISDNYFIFTRALCSIYLFNNYDS